MSGLRETLRRRADGRIDWRGMTDGDLEHLAGLASLYGDASVLAGVRRETARRDKGASQVTGPGRPPTNLTLAAKRDLLSLAAGNDIVPCYGPWTQLRDAGLATGTQHNPILTAKGRAVAAGLVSREVVL